MWKGHISQVHKWVWENFRHLIPALFARDYRELHVFGHYFDLFSLLSDHFLWNVLFHYLMNLSLSMLVQWTSFHKSKNWGYRSILIQFYWVNRSMMITHPQCHCHLPRRGSRWKPPVTYPAGCQWDRADVRSMLHSHPAATRCYCCCCSRRRPRWHSYCSVNFYKLL